ncbi:acyl carrier protein [Mycobacteroides abscessus]|uniref:acyl carrier protein n=1 Tax=Mycobacteroides abscessus TaxID=36809 RepID=UPI0021028091|nr:acyl carrier protein [Mycobacteroides abscessus]
MDRDTTASVVIKTIQSVARHYTDNITQATSLALDLGMDSVDLVELTNSLEEVFGTDIPVEATVGVDTVADVVEMLRHCHRSFHAN